MKTGKGSRGVVGGTTAAFVLLYLATCSSFIDRAAMAIALTSVGSTFGLDKVQLGTVLSSFYLGYAIMQLPGGWIADRIGSKYVVVFTIVMWSIFTVVTGMAWTFWSLLLIRFVFGIAEGAFPSASMKAIAEMFGRDRKPQMSSLLLSSSYAGSMVAPLLIAPLILIVGWRHSFMLVGGLGFVIAILYALLAPNVVPERKSPDPSKKFSTGSVLRESWLWKITIAWFCLSCVNKGLDAWMPSYLLETRHLDLKAVGLLTPLPFLVAAVTTAAGGWIMLRFFEGREGVLLAGASALTGVSLYFMYKSTDVAGVVSFQCLVYLFKSLVFATAIALPMKRLAEHSVGTGVGLVNAGGQVAGFVAPLAMGALTEYTGTYDSAFQFLIGATVLAVIMAFTIKNQSYGEEEHARA